MDSNCVRKCLLNGKVEAELASPLAALEVDLSKARLILQVPRDSACIFEAREQQEPTRFAC
jgi:hypothetical protein